MNVLFTPFCRGVFRMKRGGDDTVTQLGPQIFARITDIKTFQDVIIPPGNPHFPFVNRNTSIL